MITSFNLFLINNEPYLVSNERLIVGDSAIVSVNNLYPSLVKCQNDDQIKLIQESLLSMTKTYKVVKFPNKFDLDFQILDLLKNVDGCLSVNYIDEIITLNDENQEI